MTPSARLQGLARLPRGARDAANERAASVMESSRRSGDRQEGWPCSAPPLDKRQPGATCASTSRSDGELRYRRPRPPVGGETTRRERPGSNYTCASRRPSSAHRPFQPSDPVREDEDRARAGEGNTSCSSLEAEYALALCSRGAGAHSRRGGQRRDRLRAEAGMPSSRTDVPRLEFIGTGEKGARSRRRAGVAVKDGDAGVLAARTRSWSFRSGPRRCVEGVVRGHELRSGPACGRPPGMGADIHAPSSSDSPRDRGPARRASGRTMTRRSAPLGARPARNVERYVAWARRGARRRLGAPDPTRPSCNGFIHPALFDTWIRDGGWQEEISGRVLAVMRSGTPRRRSRFANDVRSAEPPGATPAT